MSGNDVTIDVQRLAPEEDGSDPLVAAVKRYMRLLDAGTAPSLTQYLNDYPAIADELGPAIEGLMLVHRAGRPTPAPVMPEPDHEWAIKPIGDFQIVGELGRGGMGVVYEAVQMSLGRHVALKVLPFASGLDEVRLQRFRNEAHAAAALHHTNIVPVYAVGNDRGVHYYAMQMIAGRTLADVIDDVRHSRSSSPSPTGSVLPTATPTTAPTSTPARTGSQIASSRAKSIANDSTQSAPMRSGTVANGYGSIDQSNRQRYFQSVVRMVHQAAVALDYAHQYGVVHRDIKPANLLLDGAGKVWVTDFGLAQIQEHDSQLTRTGDPMGTLRYMSPEQATGNRAVIDHRTDVYSLGVTLYELLTLEPAIRGDGYREMLNQVVEHEPIAPKVVEPKLPIELDTIVRKAISKLPSERYQTAGSFAEDLQRWLDDKPITAKPPSIIERLAKWRRRNSGLVAAATVLLLLSTVGLTITSLIIWRQQYETQSALNRETAQRTKADESFRQALSAVEAFNQLSESELASRPELQDLRRNFLETSLSFYRDFQQQRGDDPTVASMLEKTSERVEQMVRELQLLNSVAPMVMLGDAQVRKELKLDKAKAQQVSQAVIQFQSERQSLSNQNVGTLLADNQELSELLEEFDTFIRKQLNEQQIERLFQLSRQVRLPFTFKTSEVVKALQLTPAQRDSIDRIIFETRPKGMRGPGGMPDDFQRNRFAPEMNGRRPDEFGDGPNEFGGRPRFDFGPGGPPPEDPMGFGPNGDLGPMNHRDNGFRGGRENMEHGPMFGGNRGGFFNRERQAVTKLTVNAILETLNPTQRATWEKLIGPPFEPQMLNDSP